MKIRTKNRTTRSRRRKRKRRGRIPEQKRCGVNAFWKRKEKEKWKENLMDTPFLHRANMLQQEPQ
jgi:hypothetical protein